MKNENVAAPAENEQKQVFIVTRYGSIYGVYSRLDVAQEMQRILLAKNSPADVQIHIVKDSLKLQ